MTASPRIVLGVVYTPVEIVRFMIEGADWLCGRHFGLGLGDREVEVLDPAAGAGAFLCGVVRHLAGERARLVRLYRDGLRGNEVAIQPYYIASVNVESAYAAATGAYEKFEGLALRDTLEEDARSRGGICVILGNPPYNANQANENENNKNREYAVVDRRIRETYIRSSTARKTKAYDMYARFFRWASDRVERGGLIAFITNRSFLEGRTFDGFRAALAGEFDEIRVLDLGGDVRANPRLNGPRHNVFGIQAGVAISFLVRRAKPGACRIYYARRPEMETAREKLDFLSAHRLNEIGFEEVRPDARHNWSQPESNDFDSLMPVANRETKMARRAEDERAIFKLYSLGVVTARDEWVYEESEAVLRDKAAYFIDRYNQARAIDTSIKWTRAVKRDHAAGVRYRFDERYIIRSLYRPYVERYLYFDPHLNEMQYRLHELFPGGAPAPAILISGVPASKPFQCLATNHVPSYDALEKTGVLALYRHEGGVRMDNITDWALAGFRDRYPSIEVTRQGIFHYVYGVLHDPVYRERYATNLRREFPRVPFHSDFAQWAEWGRQLMDLHLGYAQVAPWPELSELPPEVTEYRLGNRSAMDWVVYEFREKTPRDPVIREKFNCYRRADYQAVVTRRMACVAAVSVATRKIVRAMNSQRG